MYRLLWLGISLATGHFYFDDGTRESVDRRSILHVLVYNKEKDNANDRFYR